MDIPTLINILIPAIFALIGIWFGNYLGFKNSYSQFIRQKIFEDQRISYSRIMALKNPWIQAIRTNIEAKILCEYYESLYFFSKDDKDLAESYKQNERALSLIKEVSNFQMQIFEALGLIQTCYEMDEKLEQAIEDIYNYKSIEVLGFPSGFKSINELNKFQDSLNEEINKKLDIEYTNKLNLLLKILKDRIIRP